MAEIYLPQKDHPNGCEQRIKNTRREHTRFFRSLHTDPDNSSGHSGFHTELRFTSLLSDTQGRGQCRHNQCSATDLNDSLDVQSHLNTGRYLYDLEQQTTNILNGSLGEPDPVDGNTGTFLDHLSTVQSFISSIPSLYAVTADSLNKGLAGHFGTLRGTVDSYLYDRLKETVDRITSFHYSEDTAYQSAVQAVSDFIDTMDGSSTTDISTYNALLSALETASNNFNTALTAGYLAADRTVL
jgi:hypothetical protein